jgi:hypothetical protein
MNTDEAIQDIRKKYPRPFTFRYQGKKVAEGCAKDVILTAHKGEYLKGVELLEYNDGRKEFRFMYLVKEGRKGWRWGQFNVCMPPELFIKILQEMIEKQWISV